MHGMIPRLFLVLALLGLLVACVEEEAIRHATVVRDSMGVSIVENSSPRWNDGEEWQLSEAPILDIGAGETDEDQLFRVRGAVRLNEGRIVVANGGTSQLRFYSAYGEHIVSVGGQGGAPGEFRGLLWIGRYRADSLIAFDQLRRRISVFDDLGRFGRTATIRSQDEVFFPDISGVWDDGSMLLFSNARHYFDAKGPMRFQNTLVRYNPDGALIDTLGTYPGPEAVGVESGPSSVFFYVPFGRTTDYAVYEDGFYVASNDTYVIERYDLNGNLKGLVRKEYALVHPTAAMIESVWARVLGDSPSPEMRTLADKAMELAPQQTIPAFGNASLLIGGSQILVDALANLWVLEIDPFGDSPPQWSVFDPQGFWMGIVAYPRSFRPLDIGSDYVLGLWRDSLDVEHVQLHDLIKPER